MEIQSYPVAPAYEVGNAITRARLRLFGLLRPLHTFRGTNFLIEMAFSNSQLSCKFKRFYFQQLYSLRGNGWWWGVNCGVHCYLSVIPSMFLYGARQLCGTSIIKKAKHTARLIEANSCFAAGIAMTSCWDTNSAIWSRILSSSLSSTSSWTKDFNALRTLQYPLHADSTQMASRLTVYEQWIV